MLSNQGMDAWILIALVEIFDINSWVNFKRKKCCYLPLSQGNTPASGLFVHVLICLIVFYLIFHM